MKSAISETQRRRQIQLAVQHRERHRPADHPQSVSDILLSLGGDTHHRDAEEGTPQAPRPPGDAVRRAGAPDPVARGRDARGGEGPAVRIRRPPARRGRRPPQGAEGAPRRPGSARDALDPGHARVARPGSAHRGRPGRLRPGACITYAGPATSISDADEELRGRRVPHARGRRPPRAHRALRSRGRVAAVA